MTVYINNISKHMYKTKKIKPFYYLNFVYQFGITIIIPLLLFIGIGIFIDKYFNTRPTFILIGAFIGFIVSLYMMYQEVKNILSFDKSMKPLSNNKKNKKPLSSKSKSKI